MKTCTKCGLEKPLDAFPKHAAYKDGRMSWCRSCFTIYSRDWRARNAESIKRTSLRYKAKRYGLDPDVIQAYFEAHNGLCDICQKPSKSGRLCIDHDHLTGRFRGLLCNSCNRALGLFGDEPPVINRAVDYLTRSLFAHMIEMKERRSIDDLAVAEEMTRRMKRVPQPDSEELLKMIEDSK